MGLLEGSSSKNGILTVVLASLFLIPIGMGSHDAFAHGTPVGYCSNEYDGPITVAVINNGTQTFDAIANPGISFNLPPKGTYYLVWIIHTPIHNAKGNSDPGHIWGNTNLQGFAMGYCEGTAYPDSNFTQTLSWSCGSNNCHPSTFWSTAVNGFSYGLNFVTPGNTTGTSVPGQPTNISPIPVSTSQIDLMWNAPSNSNVTGYKIERSSDDAIWSTISSNTNSTITMYFDSGLLPHTAYYYRVSAINSLGSSPSSSVSSGTTFVYRPALTVQTQNSIDIAVSGLNATLSRNGMMITGGPTPATFFLSSGTVYSVHVGGGGNYLFDHWADTGSKNATRDVSISNNTVLTAIVNTTSSAPQNLQATAGNSQVTLSWAAPSSNGGSPITNYEIYRSTSTGTETFLAEIGNVTLYSDTTVTNGQEYFYKVTAMTPAGESPQSNEASTTPALPPQPPTGLSATSVSPSQINLSWTAPSNTGGSVITGYKIERSADGGTEWSAITSNTGGSTTTYSDTALTPSTTYTYRVSAINGAGTSSPSGTASATTNKEGIILNNLQSTSGTTSSSNQMTFTNFDAGTSINSLLVVGISANNNNVVSVTFSGTPLTRVVSSFYNNDAEFWYMTNPSGTGNIIVTMSGPTSAVVGAYSFSGVNQTVPIPAHLAKHNTTPNSPNISITTKYANDWVLDLPSIYGGEKLGSPTCTQQWNANVPNAITGTSSSTVVQSPGTATCKWTASSADLWDDVAVEIGSYTASGTGTGTTTTAPSLPTGLTATPGNAQVDLSWTAPASNGGSAITNYKIYRSTSSGAEAFLTQAGNVTTYTDNTVTNGQAYFYKVTAVNSIGESPQSSEASAMPTAPAPTSGDKVIATIPGVTASFLSVDPGTNKIYADNEHNYLVIDRATNGITATIPFGTSDSLGGLGINPATNKVYLQDLSSNSVHVIDGNTNHIMANITNLSSGTASNIVANKNTNKVYVAAEGLAVINGTTDTLMGYVANVCTGSINWFDVNPVTNKIYVACGTNPNGLQGRQAFVSVIDGSNDTVVGKFSLPCCGFFGGVAVNPATNTVYLTDFGSHVIYVFDGNTNTLASTIPTSADGFIAANPTTNRVYASDGSSSVSVIDGSTNKIVQTLQVGKWPWQLSVDPGIGKIYVANSGSDFVSVIDGSSSTSGGSGTAGMTLDNVQSTSGTTSPSNQMTISNFNAGTSSSQLLLVGVSANSNNVGSITFAGVPLARAVSHFTNNDAEFWYLANPHGTGDITVTMNGQTQAVVGAYSFSGVNQAMPILAHITKHNLAPSSPSISITTIYPNDWVLDLPSIWGGVTLGSPTCAQQWNVNVPGQITGASSSAVVPSPATVTCSWTASSDNMWDDAAIELRAG